MTTSTYPRRKSPSGQHDRRRQYILANSRPACASAARFGLRNKKPSHCLDANLSSDRVDLKGAADDGPHATHVLYALAQGVQS
jgi:hypothetical protein